MRQESLCFHDIKLRHKSRGAACSRTDISTGVLLVRFATEWWMIRLNPFWPLVEIGVRHAALVPCLDAEGGALLRAIRTHVRARVLPTRFFAVNCRRQQIKRTLVAGAGGGR